MSCCDIYNDSFYKDIKDLDFIDKDPAFFPKLQQLRSLIKPFDKLTSGIWQPIVIVKGRSDIKYYDIFRRSEISDAVLDPCNCISISSTDINNNIESKNIDCEYCNKVLPGNYSKTWSITDRITGKTFGPLVSSYCNGASDVRTQPDDYLTKLPTLNNTYLTGLYDFKYLNQFPATASHSLGFDEFIKVPINPSIFNSLNSASCNFTVDWNICEKIGEIPPNDVNSYHNTIDDHEKSYKRHLQTTQTCGNFILLQPHTSYTGSPLYPKYPQLDNAIGNVTNTTLTPNQLPSPDFFTKPYGFKNQDFYNIFSSGNDKIGSYWKWNYTSGIMGWYRYENIDMPQDQDKRVFPGIDLYISIGDVFFAKNLGPENIATDPGSDIKNCPSGIKLLARDNTISGVIPSESEFVYISQNLYHKTYSIFNKLFNLENSLNLPERLRKTPRQKLELACLLSTSPDYDEITVDLLAKDPLDTKYTRNTYYQIGVLNEDMVTKKIDRSANSLNLIKSKKDLLTTLVNKYGSYIFIPPHTQSNISFNNLVVPPNSMFDLDFQPCIRSQDVVPNVFATGKPYCQSTTITKQYYYDQVFSIGALRLDTRQDAGGGFTNKICKSDQVLVDSQSVDTASIFFVNSLYKTYAYSSGSINFDSKYLRAPSYDLALSIVGEKLCSSGYICNEELAIKYNNVNNVKNTPLEYKAGKFDDNNVYLTRGYSCSFFNPNINLCGFHKDGGVYFDSNTFGNNNLIFNQVSKTNSPGPPVITFTTKDVGIKLYSLRLTKLRDKTNPECKTFPTDQACKCYPLKSIYTHTHKCDGTTTFTNAGRILYTPNISTHNSPDIKTYGDFSILEMVEKFDFPIFIPNHMGPQGTLPIVDQKIDPLNPYECIKNISIELPTYTNTIWNLSLDKYNTNNHTDIWASVTENVDLFRRVRYIDPEDIIYDPITSAIGTSRTPTGFGLGTLFGVSYDPFSESDTEQGSIEEEEQIEIYEPIINPFFRRYTSKVDMGGKTFYNRQTKILFDAQGSVQPLSIKIQNPFLSALLAAAGENAESIYYARLPCSLDGQSYNPLHPSGSPWLTTVNINFQQQPRKQILMYQMYPLQSMGTLKPGFFHPNSGLQPDHRPLTSLIFDKNKCYYDFDYERQRFKDTEDYSTSGSMYYAKINKKDDFILDAISSLSSHKKLRLYIQADSIWYEYLNPHVFGFYNPYNQKLYPGAAAYFEYTSFDKPKALLDHTIPPTSPADTRKKIIITKPSVLIPASAKLNIPFNYIIPSKITTSDRITHSNYFNSKYPDMPVSFKRGTIDPNSIVIESIRPYFTFEEDAVFLDIELEIKDLNPEDPRIFAQTVILDIKKEYWKYITGPKNDKYSYEFLYNRNYYDNNFSSLHFLLRNYTISKRGIVNGSWVAIKPKQIIMFDGSDPNLRRQTTYTVTSKYLTAEIVDQQGNKIEEFNINSRKNFGKKYIKISTVLLFDTCRECPLYDYGYIGFTDNNDFKNVLTLYRNMGTSVAKEYSDLLHNRNIPYVTKWGDIVNYDLKNNPDLNNSLFIQSYTQNNYPIYLNTNKYNNIIDSMVVNQLDTGVIRAILSYNMFVGSGQPHKFQQELIDYSGNAFYVQHQKYHSDNKNLYEFDIDKYENFIPLFDINFLDESFKYTKLYQNIRFNSLHNTYSTGTIFISGLRQFTTTGILSYQKPLGQEIVDLTDGKPPLKPFTPLFHPNEESYMIFSLDNETPLRPVMFSNRRFYYPTPRVDETYFPLINHTFSQSQGPVSGCTSFTIPTLLYNPGAKAPIFNYSDFKQIDNNIVRPYFIFPIYCDSDAIPECGPNSNCSYKTAGGGSLTSEYQHLEYMPRKFKDIRGRSYEYVLSFDEGLYNMEHGDPTEFPYIQRFEIPPSDEIFNQLYETNGLEGIFKWTEYSVENRKISPKHSYIDADFQDRLNQYKNTIHTALVTNTDMLANEMLFRLIHGSKQYINIETIKKKTIEDSIKPNFFDNSLSSLLQYGSVSTTPDKIYDLIPYDYSILADVSRRKIKGTIAIDGIAAIGKSFSVTIGNSTTSFTVVNENGTVVLLASNGGRSAKTILGYTSQTFETLIAVAVPGGIFPASPNTNFVKVGSCAGGLPEKSWSVTKYFSSMKYTKQEIDEEGNVQDKDINVVDEYNKCLGMVVTPDGCINVPIGEEPPDESVIALATTSPGPVCPFTCSICDSRGYKSSYNPPNGCFIVKKRTEKITWNGLSRGTFISNEELGLGCPPRHSNVSLTPELKRGSFDSFVGGVPVMHMQFSINCNPKSEPCKSYCYSLDDKDETGPVFDPIRLGALTAGVVEGPGLPCECRIPAYSYCSAGASCDPCAPHAAINFTYNFENLYSKFFGRGHILRQTKADPIVHNGLFTPLLGCGAEVGLSPSEDPKKAEAEEACIWIECNGPDRPSFDIYKAITVVPSEFKPTCPSRLAFIEYDNNNIRINIGSASFCVDHEIRRDCPLITINLPDNTFSFTDTIDSECTTCDIEPNRVLMTPQNPKWEIIEEERVAVIGSLPIEGDLNEDVVGDIINSGGSVSAAKPPCGVGDIGCCYDGCYKTEGAIGYQCGKEAPDSWLWQYVLNCQYIGSEEPSFEPCISEFQAGQGTLFPTLVNGKSKIGFAQGSDNKTIMYRHIEYWEKLMSLVYADTHICQRTLPNNVNIDDMIEGVIPGSCSELKFTGFGFPATAFRQTLEGGEARSITYGVKVAYYTYKYRRPKTIEDALRGKENSVKCNTLTSFAGGGNASTASAFNITEKYSTEKNNCQKTPTCYDTIVSPCDANNYCCQLNKPNLGSS